MNDHYKQIANKKIKTEALDEQIIMLDFTQNKGKDKLKEMLEAHTQKQI